MYQSAVDYSCGFYYCRVSVSLGATGSLSASAVFTMSLQVASCQSRSVYSPAILSARQPRYPAIPAIRSWKTEPARTSQENTGCKQPVAPKRCRLNGVMTALQECDSCFCHTNATLDEQRLLYRGQKRLAQPSEARFSDCTTIPRKMRKHEGDDQSRRASTPRLTSGQWLKPGRSKSQWSSWVIFRKSALVPQRKGRKRTTEARRSRRNQKR